MSPRAIILKLESKSFLSFYNGFFIITLSVLGQFGIWLKIKNKKQKTKKRCVYGTKRRVQRLLRPKTALLPCRWKHRHVLFLVEQGMLALMVRFDTKRHVQRLLASKKCPSYHIVKSFVVFSSLRSNVCQRWWVVQFVIGVPPPFYSLSSLENYSLILFVVGILTLIFILLISNFFFLAIFQKFYLFSISSFNPN